MPRKISFLNYKGGVGKTSLIVNTAACLARLGKRVLLFDLDTQSNASIWLMKLDRWNKLNADNAGSIYSLFEPGRAHLRDLVIRDVLEGKSGEKILPGLDLVPTTFNLVDLEGEYRGDPKRPAYLIFQEQLSTIERDYDFVLFDCPPNILRASQCGVFSSNEIYVPANPDALSLIGFTLLIEKLQQFQALSASFRTAAMGPAAQVQGIVMNAIKTGSDIEVPKMRMQLRLNQFKAARRVAAGARILDAQIRDAMIVRRAVTLGLPVNLVAQDANAAPDADNVVTDYRKLAEELVRHAPSTELVTPPAAANAERRPFTPPLSPRAKSSHPFLPVVLPN
ncbi:MAG TPA: AAA family ATPase [Opitutus sp.]|nr:AAA family ATPase [Opitutus sp.]